jgi:protein-disulfide isomerase
MSQASRPRFRPTAMLLAACLVGGLATYPARAQSSGTPALSTPVPAKSAFSAEQRAEIVRIVRDALKQDPSILREAVTALQADEADQQATATRAAIVAQHAALSNPADPSAGNPKGDVTIVEFFDTRCPYCRHMDPTMTAVLQQDPGVKLVFKDLPILGPASLLGSKALLAAQRQGGYEKLRTAIMQSPPDLTTDMLQKLAVGVGLDWPRLQRDMDDPAIAQRLEDNVQLAHDLGIEGTPVLVIGDGLVPGAVEIADIAKAVNEARKAAKSGGG